VPYNHLSMDPLENRPTADKNGVPLAYIGRRCLFRGAHLSQIPLLAGSAQVPLACPSNPSNLIARPSVLEPFTASSSSRFANLIPVFGDLTSPRNRQRFPY